MAELADGGRILHTPPFSFRIRSSSRILAEALSIAYAGYEWLDDAAFVDFDLQVLPDSGLRRWVRPQIRINVDGDFPFAPLPVAQVFPLLEWAMNWCVTTSAHQFLMCHCAVLARGDLAVLLPGPPGSGKSTLCAGLMLSGWRLLSDELALIHTEDVTLTPFVRPVSLKNASIPLISARFPKAVFTAAVRDTIKGVVAHVRPTTLSHDASKIPAMPRWLVFPTFEVDSELEIRPMGKAEALVELARNAFNLPVLGPKGLDALKAVVERSECFSMRYSHLEEGIARFDALAALG